MSIQICKECGNTLSSHADKCPSCGITVKKQVKHYGFGTLAMVLLVIFGGMKACSSNETTTNAPSSSNAASSAVEGRWPKGFSPLDGSHRALTKVIKESMNDPKSFEHVETSYNDHGDYLIVRTKFRGKNGFGALVVNSITAQVDLEGNVLTILPEGETDVPGLKKPSTKNCAAVQEYAKLVAQKRKDGVSEFEAMDAILPDKSPNTILSLVTAAAYAKESDDAKLPSVVLGMCSDAGIK
jgi:hypothetical protein